MKAAYDSGDLDVKRQVLEIVKRRVVNDYFIVGILEQFEDTLQLFETMLPMFYKGAMDAWKSDCKLRSWFYHAVGLNLQLLEIQVQLEIQILK